MDYWYWTTTAVPRCQLLRTLVLATLHESILRLLVMQTLHVRIRMAIRPYKSCIIRSGDNQVIRSIGHTSCVHMRRSGRRVVQLKTLGKVAAQVTPECPLLKTYSIQPDDIDLSKNHLQTKHSKLNAY